MTYEQVKAMQSSSHKNGRQTFVSNAYPSNSFFFFVFPSRDICLREIFDKEYPVM